MVPWLGYPAFTLLLRVRNSRVGFYNGVRRRLTEFSVIYDERNWWDKAINAGPYFIANKLDEDGEDIPLEFVKYPYIYYTDDTETNSSDLAIDQKGLLKGNTAVITRQGTRLVNEYVSGKWAVTSLFLQTQHIPQNWGRAYAGVTKVTKADGKKTYRANKPSDVIEPWVLEYQNHNVLPFAGYLRPTLTGPYIP
jgi:hypothetical protein